MNEEIKKLTSDLLDVLREYNPEELCAIWQEWEKELDHEKFTPIVREYCKSLVEAVMLQKLEKNIGASESVGICLETLI